MYNLNVLRFVERVLQYSIVISAIERNGISLQYDYGCSVAHIPEEIVVDSNSTHTISLDKQYILSASRLNQLGHRSSAVKGVRHTVEEI